MPTLLSSILDSGVESDLIRIEARSCRIWLSPDPISGSVSDPDFIHPGSRSGSSILGWADPDPGFLMIKKWRRNNYNWRKIWYFFWSKIAIYLSLGLHKGRQSYRRSLQITKEILFICPDLKRLVLFFACHWHLLPVGCKDFQKCRNNQYKANKSL